MKKNLLSKIMVIVTIVLLLLACVVQSISNYDEKLNEEFLAGNILSTDWWNADWYYRKQITIDHTKVDTDLENFPILLVNTSSNFSEYAQLDGDDFVFVDSSNTVKYNHEIEYYDDESGELITWVNVTSLSSSEDTILWLYYSNEDCDNQENVEGTWDDNYIGVWHMGESSGNIIDSTGTKDGVVVGSPDYQKTGKIGKCIYFDGVNNEYFNIVDETYKFNQEDVLLEIWVYYVENRNMYEPPLYFGDDDNIPQLSIQKERSGVGGHLYAINCLSNSESEIAMSTEGGETHVGHWIYQIGRFERGVETSLGINGQKEPDVDSCSNNNLNSASQFLARIGKGGVGGGSYMPNSAHIYLDEVRVSNIARNMSWINTSYNNQNNLDSFINVGEEEPVNYLPIVDFTYIPENPIQTDTIQFNDASIDPDGNITAWSWNFGDGNTSTLQNPTHQYADYGNYTVTLTVTDDFGATNDTSKLIIVANSQPIADYSYSPVNPMINETIYFTDTSYDIDGTIVDWEWDFDDGYISTLQNPTHDYSIEGIYNVNLTVTDDDGATDTIQKTIVVTLEPNKPPDAPIIGGPTSGKPSDTCIYSFEATDPEEHNIYLYIDWGDGTNTSWLGPLDSGEKIYANHSWAEKGTYTIMAKAKDIYEAIGEWGTFDVTMPKNKVFNFNFPLLNWLFERFPNTLPILRYLAGL